MSLICKPELATMVAELAAMAAAESWPQFGS